MEGFAKFFNKFINSHCAMCNLKLAPGLSVFGRKKVTGRWEILCPNCHRIFLGNKALDSSPCDSGETQIPPKSLCNHDPISEAMQKAIASATKSSFEASTGQLYNVLANGFAAEPGFDGTFGKAIDPLDTLIVSSFEEMLDRADEKFNAMSGVKNAIETAEEPIAKLSDILEENAEW